jgi:hypothetical protein
MFIQLISIHVASCDTINGCFTRRECIAAVGLPSAAAAAENRFFISVQIKRLAGQQTELRLPPALRLLTIESDW